MLVATPAHATTPAARSLSGWQLRIDTGPAARFAVNGEAGGDAWQFGVSLAYAFRSGFSVDARYADLGVSRDGVMTPLQTASSGVRFSIPLRVMPFGELRCGTAFDATGAYFASAVAVGLDIPFTRFLVGEMSVRDWLVPDSATLHSLVTFNLGLTVRFVQ